MTETIIFYILALFLVGGSIGMVANRNTVFSAASFMLAMIALSGMFALLQQGFLFLAQIMVAVGAVITLSLLVIVSVNIHPRYLPEEPNLPKWIGVSALLAAPVVALLYEAFMQTPLSFGEVGEGFGSVRTLGSALFSEWVLPFELVSVLLLIAMLAGIVISQRRSDHDA